MNTVSISTDSKFILPNAESKSIKSRSNEQVELALLVQSFYHIQYLCMFQLFSWSYNYQWNYTFSPKLWCLEILCRSEPYYQKYLEQH